MRYASALALVLFMAGPAHALVASSDFADVVRRHRPELVRCYEASPERSTEPIVRLMLRLEIAADGHVASARVPRPESVGLGLRSCIEASALTWRFPGGRLESITLTYPLVFAP